MQCVGVYDFVRKKQYPFRKHPKSGTIGLNINVNNETSDANGHEKDKKEFK